LLENSLLNFRCFVQNFLETLDPFGDQRDHDVSTYLYNKSLELEPRACKQLPRFVRIIQSTHVHIVLTIYQIILAPEVARFEFEVARNQAKKSSWQNISNSFASCPKTERQWRRHSPHSFHARMLTHHTDGSQQLRLQRFRPHHNRTNW
jgi:hypothetical protein